ncbi:S1C family serine protease [Mucilaginibacter paludis]|uniref:PDZ/DHR/GLGF domain protein n=1 Tax=Mucilaginibacter paludis DSM 18603 TaxID=714943 RepID=H1Y4M9_9SPHI|nr:trypsin-like peptidase domain-containing protein [Mucilaginibacter paludis]EHQ28073.1 PDZ/DHR/GLGF domain protein [Mucilaginibacter paludis DSM 18603]
MRNISRLFVLTIFLFIHPDAYSQQFSGRQLEQTVFKAIAKAYPASVRIWGFDTVSKQQMSAQFSGVVVTQEGYILTAAHVTIPGKTYQVTFPDGRKCIAVALGKIEYADDKTIPDVALMKIITKGNWPHAEMGISSTLKEYEPCLSIAYPESLNQARPTVRFGWVTRATNQRGFVQSTCKMEPGDSGGPLFDELGRVIALHSAIEVPEDLNYEIPVDLYKKYWTALNKPQIYTRLPDTADLIKDERPIRKVLTVPGLKHLNANFADISSHFKKSSIYITVSDNGKQQRVVGTLFSLSGLAFSKNVKNQSVIVGKNSLIGYGPLFVLVGNKRIQAKVLTRDKQNDLVLLRPYIEINGGIELKTIDHDPADIKPGKFLLSLLPDTAGIASVAGSNLFSIAKISSNGFLGAAIAYQDGPLLLTRIQPNSPASESGLQIADEVLFINGIEMRKAEDYGKVLQKYWPGDTVRLQMRRGGAAFEKKVVLGLMPSPKVNHPAELFNGGKSIRRDGFEKVFSHDAILQADQCGGPVFDLYGHLCGLNIARFSRASCLTLPTNCIYQFIDHYFSMKALMR